MTKSKGLRIHNRNLVGCKFERWTVVDYAVRNKFGFAMWKCQCECGTINIVCENTLIRGKSKSCGCIAKEVHSARGRHHESHNNSTYSSWIHMNSRCNNPNSNGYNNYGGRGIKICDRWKIYENFRDDMGEKPGSEYSIDRIDNDGNYEPDNCRWSTFKEQMNNQGNKICPLCGKTCGSGAGLALHKRKEHPCGKESLNTK